MNKALEKYIRDHGMVKKPSTIQRLFTRLTRSSIDNINVTNKNK